MVAGNFTTLPEYFKQNGYFTYSIGKVFHPGSSSNFTDDFPYSWSKEAFHPKSAKYLNAPVCIDEETGDEYENLLCPVDLNLFPEHILPDIESTLHAKKVLNVSYTSKQPFFLAIGFHKPHIPFQFPRKYLDSHRLDKFLLPDEDFKPFGLPDVAWNPFNDLRKRHDVAALNLSYPFGTLPKKFRMKARQHYYASVSYIDDLIGELLQNVNPSNTIVVLTSDHGWSLGEHTEWAKYSNFDVALRVPLIIYDPSQLQLQPKRISEISELVDIFPTLVDLTGLPKLQKCSSAAGVEGFKVCTEGQSLKKLMSRKFKRQKELVAVSQYPRPSTFPSEYPNSDQPKEKQIKIMGYTIRNSQFRYTAWIEFDAKTFKKSKRWLWQLLRFEFWLITQPLLYRLVNYLCRGAVRSLFWWCGALKSGTSTWIWLAKEDDEAKIEKKNK